ncbi:hypothetical protein PBY51_008955 [Eleginops maclovinus]|uniref:C-type lectin domain-containing protein n=1 Tax=Eleginops maclovinus TaxID=56733 RepID=A0AAN7WTG3_ELEMC|nr:hypothetical protein PBY51_008955 [Eleginops maclovinus]
MALFLFLLCSGLFHFAFTSQRLRILYFPKGDTGVAWNESLVNCALENGSPVTLYDQEDADFTSKFLKSELSRQKPLWLGLNKRQRNHTWSDGVNVSFSKSSVNETEGKPICEAIDNNTWTGHNCSEEKYFMCSNGSSYTLITEEKSWCQALKHCRTYYKDLVSILNEIQNDEVIGKGHNTSFWIGLLHDDWKWHDNGCSSYRDWMKKTQSHSIEEEKHCTVYQGAQLNQMSCTRDAKTGFCSKGTMRIIVINKNLTWEGAFDYCQKHHSGPLWIEDEGDQKAVEQWLTHSNVNGSFWIALRQTHVFGFWIWRDSQVCYNNWKDGTVPVPPSSNLCGVIDKTENYKWRDEECLLEHPFLCEEEIVIL